MAKLSSAELSKREEIIQGMLKNKRTLVKRYIKDKIAKGEEPINPEAVMYGRATNIAKKVAESEMENINLKELVRAALMNEKAGFSKEYDNDPALKGGQKNLPDGLQKAIIAKATNEDLDLGHEDDEPHMIKGDLYRIGKYAMELYQMVDQFEGQGEVDFPAWWQSKITTAKNMVSSAKHYLEFELKEPEIDAMVGVAAAEDIIPNVPTEPLEDEIEEGIYDKNITSAPHTNVKGEMKPYNPKDRATSLARLAKFGPKSKDDKVDEKKLTKPELKKREEVAKAIEKDNPKMDMGKKMAIASDIAKRVAERISAGK